MLQKYKLDIRTESATTRYNLEEFKAIMRPCVEGDAQLDSHTILRLDMLIHDLQDHINGKADIYTFHDQSDILRRYPRLISHMICESLGYFTPRSAANALIAHMENSTCFCEWYSHMTNLRGNGYFDKDTNRQIVHDVVGWAFANRHRHSGYMANYQKALAIVERQNESGQSPAFASWF